MNFLYICLFSCTHQSRSQPKSCKYGINEHRGVASDLLYIIRIDFSALSHLFWH